MKDFIKKIFTRSSTPKAETEFSHEKIEQFSDEIMKKYGKTFADLARYDVKDI